MATVLILPAVKYTDAGEMLMPVVVELVLDSQPIINPARNNPTPNPNTLLAIFILFPSSVLTT